MTTLLHSLFLLLFNFASANFGAVPGLNTIPEDYKCRGNAIEVADPPPVRTALSELCYAGTTELLLVHRSCKQRSTKTTNMCANLTANDRISLLDLARYKETIEDDEERERSYYPAIHQGEPGSAYAVILNLLTSGRDPIMESCAPYDAFIAGANSIEEQVEQEKEMWKTLRGIYDKNKTTQPNDTCADCNAYHSQTTGEESPRHPELTRIQKQYNSKVSNKELLEAFGAKTYAEFLRQVLVPEKCDFHSLMIPLRTQLRNNVTAKRTPAGEIKKIKELLTKQTLVGVASLCLDSELSKSEKCTRGHSVVIAGYCEQMCKKGAKPECKKAVRVLNSWGQTWQDQNNNGWVEAEALIERTPYKSDYVSLMWLQDAPVEGEK